MTRTRLVHYPEQTPESEAITRQLGEVLRHAPQWPPPLQPREKSRAVRNIRRRALRAERKAASK